MFEEAWFPFAFIIFTAVCCVGAAFLGKFLGRKFREQQENKLLFEHRKCVLEDCHIRPDHYHTGNFHEYTVDEWYCPTEHRWTSCPGPCPDGKPHQIKRSHEKKLEHIKLLEGFNDGTNA
jgi:hypothetical protein